MTHTPQEIRTFQAAHRDWLGKPLRVDGDLGPRTAWSMAIEQQDRRVVRAVRRVCNWVGLVEQPGNRGVPIDGWILRCGVELGSPWCAAFASWGLSITGSEEVAIAGAVNLGRHFTAVPPGSLIRPTDVVWFPTDDAGHGHTGLAISSDGVFEGEHVVATVEGNLRNAVRVQLRRCAEVHVSRPWPDATGSYVPLPTDLEIVAAHWNGTR